MGRSLARMTGSSAVSTSRSWRYIFTLRRFTSAETALTKCLLPSAQLTRAATPGLKPPACVLASTTGEPQTCSTADRTRGGTA